MGPPAKAAKLDDEHPALVAARQAPIGESLSAEEEEAVRAAIADARAGAAASSAEISAMIEARRLAEGE
jgi:flagella basal body P-ring formation protein FlgA